MKHLLSRLINSTPRSDDVLKRWSRAKRAVSGYDRALMRDFMQQQGTRKLHLGGGWYTLPGWLNTDIDTVPGVMYMDATRPFPLPDASFDAVYSEHMIEHVSYGSGLAMLGESFRVLRSGGSVRIVTPDIRSVLSLATIGEDDLRTRYLAWFCDTFCPPGTPPTWDQAINTFFYSWGHRFLYTETTLRASLEEAGFVNVRRTTLNESGTDWLRDLPNEARHPPGFLEFESLTLEADKP